MSAYNKKRFDESDLLKLHRKTIDSNLPLFLISRGELSKKTEDAIKSSKRLKKVAQFEA